MRAQRTCPGSGSSLPLWRGLSPGTRLLEPLHAANPGHSRRANGLKARARDRDLGDVDLKPPGSVGNHHNLQCSRDKQMSCSRASLVTLRKSEETADGSTPAEKTFYPGSKESQDISPPTPVRYRSLTGTPGCTGQFAPCFPPILGLVRKHKWEQFPPGPSQPAATATSTASAEGQKP